MGVNSLSFWLGGKGSASVVGGWTAFCMGVELSVPETSRLVSDRAPSGQRAEGLMDRLLEAVADAGREAAAPREAGLAQEDSAAAVGGRLCWISRLRGVIR